MLVLTIKENGSIQIGEDITITMLAVWKTRTKVGIEAPKELNIKRIPPPDVEKGDQRL